PLRSTDLHRLPRAMRCHYPDTSTSPSAERQRSGVFFLAAGSSYDRGHASTYVNSVPSRIQILPGNSGVTGGRPRIQRDQELDVQTGAGAGLAEPGESTTRLTEGIARGAAVVASLTILSRILGLVRTLVFSQTVGASCLGTAYVTANQVPDLLYQLILGGALTSAMIPVLARSPEPGARDPAEKAQASRIPPPPLPW